VPALREPTVTLSADSGVSAKDLTRISRRLAPGFGVSKLTTGTVPFRAEADGLHDGNAGALGNHFRQSVR
jgi:hypothetical protein